MNRKDLLAAINQTMPFGKYKGRKLLDLPEPYRVVHTVNSVTVRVAIAPGAALRKLERAPLLLRFLALPRTLWLCSFVTQFTPWTTSVVHGQGFPDNKLGQQLALIYEIKLNGLEGLLQELKAP